MDVLPDIVTPKFVTANIGDKVQYTCKYDNDVKWFFMDTVSLPQYSPISYGKVLTITVKPEFSGFIFCSGVKPDMKRYLARAFLEIASMLL